MIKTPIDIREMQSPYVRRKLISILEAADLFRDSRTSCVVDRVILKDAGTILTQLAWSDETGFYVVFRCDPLTISGKPETRAKLVSEFIAELDRIFVLPKSKSVIELGNDLEDAVEVRYVMSSHTIGD